MKIETGHSVSKDARVVDSDRVRFVAEDGRTMFEVVAGKDGRSIEVRGVETCLVNGVLYSSMIEIRPQVTNQVTIRAREYDDGNALFESKQYKTKAAAASAARKLK